MKKTAEDRGSPLVKALLGNYCFHGPDHDMRSLGTYLVGNEYLATFYCTRCLLIVHEDGSTKKL